MNSTKFMTFFKFAAYCHRMNLPMETFIDIIMKQAGDIPPTLWCNPHVYSLYLRLYDSSHNPFDQVADSIEFIHKHAEREGCDPKDVFSVLGFNTILEFFRQRKLSPWFLYNSESSLKFLKSLDDDDYLLFEKTINSEAWAERFSENEEVNKELRVDIKEIGL